MKILIQKRGMKGAIPYGAPRELSLASTIGCFSDTERRNNLLRYLDENKTDVNTHSYIEIKLRHELESFRKNGKKDFKIYHCKGIYGFLYADERMASSAIRMAYFETADINPDKPWCIDIQSNDKENYSEICYNVVIDKNNRICY